MTGVKKRNWKQDYQEAWQGFKKGLTWNNIKIGLTWNNIKIGISAGTPIIIGAWLYVQWIHILIPIMDKYTSNIKTPVTQEEAIISLCLIMGIIFPIWILFLWSSYGGMWLGKVTRFYRDDKTRSVWWDNVTYFVRDMPDEERQKIASILSPYKSKVQLRKERMKDKSWLRRTFT